MSLKDLQVNNKKTFFFIIIIVSVFVLFFCYLHVKPFFKKSTFDLPSLKPKHDKKRLFCIIFTTKYYLESRAKFVYESWAKKCDNHRFITLIPNHTPKANESIDLIYNNSFSLLKPTEMIIDQYSKNTDKLYFSFKDIYKNFPDYKWYLRCDDDTFIFMKNLYDFLETKDPYYPVTYGHDFKVIVKHGYHSGGGGFVMSQLAFNKLGKKLIEDPKFCPNSGIDDVDVAVCFQKLGVYSNTTLDEFGRERFHPVSIKSYYFGIDTDWLHGYSKNKVQKVKI